MTLAEMLVAPWHGNYHSDSRLLSELGSYALDPTNPLTDRAKAIRRIDMIMGCADDSENMTDEALVDQYMRDVSELGWG